VSLSGAIRPVTQGPARLKEAAKLGFTRAVVPEAARTEAGEPGLKVTDLASLSNLVAEIAARSTRGTGGKTRGQDG
jgi:DNA repair protein RadA/Sms